MNGQSIQNLQSASDAMFGRKHHVRDRGKLHHLVWHAIISDSLAMSRIAPRFISTDASHAVSITCARSWPWWGDGGADL